MAFNIQAAKQAGYTDQEIQDYLGQQHPVQSGVQHVSNFLRGMGLGIVPDIAGNATFGVQEAMNGVNPVTGSGATRDKLQEIASQNPFMTGQQVQHQGGRPLQLAQQIGKDTAGAASWAVPVGGSAKAAASLGGLSGLLSGVSQDNATPGSVAGSAAFGAGTGALLSRFAPMLNKVGQHTEQAGKEFVLHGLHANPSQETNFAKKTGQNLADYVQKQGWTGDFAENASKHVGDLQDAFDQLALQTDKKVPMTAVASAFEPYVSQLKESIVPGVQNKAGELSTVVGNLQKKYGNNISVADITKERKAMDELVSGNQFALAPEVANYFTNARRALQDAARGATADQSVNGMGLKEIGNELHNAIEFKNITDKQAALGHGSKAMGTGSKVAGGIGSTIGSIIGGLPGAIVGGGVGIGADKLLNSTPVVGAESRMMQGAGRTIQGISQAQLPALLRQLILRGGRNAGAAVGGAAGQIFGQ